MFPLGLKSWYGWYYWANAAPLAKNYYSSSSYRDLGKTPAALSIYLGIELYYLFFRFCFFDMLWGAIPPCPFKKIFSYLWLPLAICIYSSWYLSPFCQCGLLKVGKFSYPYRGDYRFGYLDVSVYPPISVPFIPLIEADNYDDLTSLLTDAPLGDGIGK